MLWGRENTLLETHLLVCVSSQSASENREGEPSDLKLALTPQFQPTTSDHVPPN